MENESREVKDTSWISELRNKKWEMEETWSKNGHTELEGFMRYFYIFYFIFLSHVNFEASVQFSSVAQSCPTLCDPKNCSTPGLPIHHQLPEFTQTQVHWISDAISSTVVPFSSCPQSLPASESFPMSQPFAWGGQNTGVSTLASFLPNKSQGWSPCSPRDSQESSPTP